MALVGARRALDDLAAAGLHVAACALQRLDRWLLVNAEHQGVVRRIQVQPDHVVRFGCELGIGADAPGAVTLQLDALLAQHAPYGDIGHPQRGGKTPVIPARHALWWRKLQLREDSIAKFDTVLGWLAGPGLISRQAGDLHVPGLHIHLRQVPTGSIPAPPRDQGRSDEGEAPGDKEDSAQAPACHDPAAGKVAP